VVKQIFYPLTRNEDVCAMRFLSRLLVCVAVLSLAPFSAHASGQQRLVAAYEAWEVYTFTENGNKVCYMASQPGNATGNYTKRGDPFALITHRPSDNTRDVFSYIAGYPYKEGSQTKLKIDDQEFLLFTQGETAWAPDSETDRKIAEAIRNGKTMVVNGTSARGTLTTDTYSLKGSTSAYKRISEECR
jgi:invasion protein IalB